MLRYLERHANAQYEGELKELVDTLNHMRSLVLTQCHLLEKVLRKEDTAQLAAKREAKEVDREINLLQQKADQAVLNILSRHSPQLVELRFVLSAPKIASQFERMGDHCKNTVKRVSRTQAKLPDGVWAHIIELAKQTIALLASLEDVMLHFDEAQARELLEKDRQVDKLYKQLVMHMPHMLDEETIDSDVVSDVLFIAKNLERLADHAIDMIREIYYIHNGQRMMIAA